MCALFSSFGRVLQVSVRKRTLDEDGGLSWALITFSETEAVKRVLALANGENWVVIDDSVTNDARMQHSFKVQTISRAKSMASTGKFAQLWRLGEAKCDEAIRGLMASSEVSGQLRNGGGKHHWLEHWVSASQQASFRAAIGTQSTRTDVAFAFAVVSGCDIVFQSR